MMTCRLAIFPGPGARPAGEARKNGERGARGHERDGNRLRNRKRPDGGPGVAAQIFDAKANDCIANKINACRVAAVFAINRNQNCEQQEQRRRLEKLRRQNTYRLPTVFIPTRATGRKGYGAPRVGIAAVATTVKETTNAPESVAKRNYSGKKIA